MRTFARTWEDQVLADEGEEAAEAADDGNDLRPWSWPRMGLLLSFVLGSAKAINSQREMQSINLRWLRVICEILIDCGLFFDLRIVCLLCGRVFVASIMVFVWMSISDLDVWMMLQYVSIVECIRGSWKFDVSFLVDWWIIRSLDKFVLMFFCYFF